MWNCELLHVATCNHSLSSSVPELFIFASYCIDAFTIYSFSLIFYEILLHSQSVMSRRFRFPFAQKLISTPTLEKNDQNHLPSTSGGFVWPPPLLPLPPSPLLSWDARSLINTAVNAFWWKDFNHVQSSYHVKAAYDFLEQRIPRRQHCYAFSDFNAVRATWN